MSITKRPSPISRRADLESVDRRQQMGEVLALRKAFFQIMGAPKRTPKPKRTSSQAETNDSEPLPD